eukprot:EG_transcript_9590
MQGVNNPRCRQLPIPGIYNASRRTYLASFPVMQLQVRQQSIHSWTGDLAGHWIFAIPLPSQSMYLSATSELWCPGVRFADPSPVHLLCSCIGLALFRSCRSCSAHDCRSLPKPKK